MVKRTPLGSERLGKSTCVQPREDPCHCVPVGFEQQVSRRAVLVAASGIAGAGVLAACGDGIAASGPADDPIATEVAAAEQALIAQYQAFIAAFPQLNAELAPILDQHADHLKALGVTGPSTQAPVAASDARTAVAVLADAEREAAKSRRTSCVAATNPELARLLALIAASEASHAPALTKMLAT